MTRLMVWGTFVMFLLVTKCHAQSQAVTPQADAGHAPRAGCVILQHMGPVDRGKSRLYSLGLRGKQFRYIDVEGKLPEGLSLRDRLTNHDVRNLHVRGVEVIVLAPHYTSEELKEARANCRGETGKTPNQAELIVPPASATDGITSTPAPTPKMDDSTSATGGTEAALLDVSSTPTEADVYVDEHFSARTPSTIILMPGDHKIAIKKLGFVVWQKKLKLLSGRISVAAELLPKTK